MKRPAAVLLSVLVSTILVAMPTRGGEELPATVIDDLGRAFEYYDVLEYYDTVFDDLLSKYQMCRARGFDEELCRSTYAYCAFNAIPVGGVAGAFIAAFELNQLFRVDCGDGTCYQCCYVPQNSNCHTSFVGFPVINCNAGYGQGTRNAGLTLVTDPDATPGQACLFTPQTCDHIPLCLSGRPPATISSINNNPNHILHSAAAASWRALNMGREAFKAWAEFMDGHHTSLPADDPMVESPRSRLIPVHAIGDFVSARGCTGWRDTLASVYPFDWSHQQFRIEDEVGNFAVGPSHLNAIHQLGTVRLLSSVPNLHQRLGVVESRIRVPSEISQYLEAVDNPDRALLAHMSPVGLEVFKRISTVQDYRLFAVPLVGETVDANLFNGCHLGNPPSIEASYQQQGAFGVRLQVSPGPAQPEPLDALVVWGDGTISSLALSGGSPVQIDHQYRRGGKYQVLIVVVNASGLRANRGLVVQTQGAGTNGAATPIPVVSEVQLLDLRGRLGAANGLSSMYFQLETWPEANAAYLLGNSRSLGVSDGSSTSFGHLIGWNMTGRTLSRVLLRPVWYDLQFAMGARPAHFTLGGIRIGVYSTASHRLQYVDIPIEAQNIRLYLEGSPVPSTLDNPTYDDQGRLKIPIVSAGQHFDRVELIFPQWALDEALQGPVLDPTWTGINAQLQEGRPGSVLDRSVFADGFEGGDTTAWTTTLSTP